MGPKTPLIDPSPVNRGSYTSGHMKFMTQTFGEFHKFHMKWPPVYDSVYHMTLKNGILWDFKMNNISIRKHIVGMDVVSDVTGLRQSVITWLVIWFLWHDVIRWITAMSCDKSFLWLDGWLAIYVLQSYQDDGRMMMKGFVQWHPVFSWEDFTLSRARPRDS